MNIDVEKSKLIIRNFKIDDFDAAQKWIHQDVQWNLGNKSQWNFYISKDAQGWIVGEISGELIGNLLGMIIDEKRALIGIFIIRKDLRFKGYGKVLWDSLMSHLGSRTLSLYSVDYRIDGYKKLGFGDPTFQAHIYDAHLKDMDDKLASSLRAENNHASDYSIIDLRSAQAQGLFDKLIAYDTSIHTTERASYLQMCHKDKENTLSILAATSKTGEVLGYAMIIKRLVGWSIAPLYADEAQIATDLLNTCLRTIPNPGGTNLELVSPVKYFNPSKYTTNSNLSQGAKEELLNYWNNRLKLWIDGNIINSKAFTGVDVHAQIYRMYRVSSDIKNSADVNHIPFEYLPKSTDCSNFGGKSSHETAEINILGMKNIPLSKVYCMSSVEAFWI